MCLYLFAATSMYVVVERGEAYVSSVICIMHMGPCAVGRGPSVAPQTSNSQGLVALTGSAEPRFQVPCLAAGWGGRGCTTSGQVPVEVLGSGF